MEVTARGGEGSSLQLEGSGCGDGELAGAQVRWRLSRESTLARHTGLRGAMADLSFLLARGPPNLLGFLRSTASASGYSQLLLFRHSQSIPDLQGFDIAITSGCFDVGPSCLAPVRRNACESVFFWVYCRLAHYCP